MHRVLKVKGILHSTLIVYPFHMKIYYVKIKVIPMRLLEQFLSCGAATGPPFSICYETCYRPHHFRIQLFLASGLSIVTFTLKCLSPSMVEIGIY